MQNSKALLHVAQEGEEPKGTPLNGELLTIGRWPDNDIVLPDRMVSRHHAHIHREGDCYVLEDLGSTNGTFVNGARLGSRHRLDDGDRIQIPPDFQLHFALQTEDVSTQTQHSGLRIEPESHDVIIDGDVLDPQLSQAQYTLLELLIRQDGKVVPREDIITAIWPPNEAASVTDQAIDALVRRLRERISEVDPDHQYVVTVRGHGFRFENR